MYWRTSSKLSKLGIMGVPGTSGLPKVPASVLSTESTIIELKEILTFKGRGVEKMI